MKFTSRSQGGGMQLVMKYEVHKSIARWWNAIGERRDSRDVSELILISKYIYIALKIENRYVLVYVREYEYETNMD